MAQDRHIFATINYVHAADEGAEVLESVFPRNVPSEAVSPCDTTFVVLGDLSQPELKAAGSTSVPMPLPDASSRGGTCSYFHVTVLTNIPGGSSSISLLVGGANGNQTIPICSGAFGKFTDVTHTDSLGTNSQNPRIRIAYSRPMTLSALSLLFQEAL
jgi:hypothetical protein